jgi:hypothetical protein
MLQCGQNRIALYGSNFHQFLNNGSPSGTRQKNASLAQIDAGRGQSF